MSPFAPLASVSLSLTGTTRILLAKSLQGDKPTRYYTLWLSLSGYKSYFRPVWRHNATRFSRKGYAPATSPTVSTRFPAASDRGDEQGGEGQKRQRTASGN